MIYVVMFELEIEEMEIEELEVEEIMANIDIDDYI